MTYQYLLNKYGTTLTFEEAGKELNLFWQTVQEMCRRGEIKAKKAGRKWILTTKAIAEYLDSENTKEPEKNTPAVKTKGGYVKYV